MLSSESYVTNLPFSDKIKLSFVIFLQRSPSYSTEQETHRRQKKKFLSNKEVIFIGAKGDMRFVMITITNNSLNQNVLSFSSE